MNCDYVRDKLYEYIYGELKPEDKELVEIHLQECSVCSDEYKSLNKLLLKDMEPLTNLTEVIDVPSDLKSKIYKGMNKNKRYRPLRYAAACLVFLMLYTFPVAAFYINQNNLISKYKELDPNMVESFEDKNGQLVCKSSSMRDVTFTVDGIIKEKDKTTILFTTKLPRDYFVNYSMPLYESIKIEDQFGRSYRLQGASMNLRDVKEDGEIEGIVEIEPLKSFTFKLNIRVTAMQLGDITVIKGSDNNIEYKDKKYKNLYGNWNVNFIVN